MSGNNIEISSFGESSTLKGISRRRKLYTRKRGFRVSGMKKTKIDAIVLFREYYDNLEQCVGAGLGSD